MRFIVPSIATGIALLAAATANAASPGGARTLLYVDNSLGDDITVIDLGTLKVTDTIRVGNLPHALSRQFSPTSCVTFDAATIWRR